MQEDMHENNGMTVKQFVDILKKSWVTIVICVLIVAVVFGSFLAIVKVVATDTYYQGTLYFADTSNNDAPVAATVRTCLMLCVRNNAPNVSTGIITKRNSMLNISLYFYPSTFQINNKQATTASSNAPT